MKQENNMIIKEEIDTNISIIWNKIIKKYKKYRLSTPFSTEEIEKFQTFAECYNVVKKNQHNIDWTTILKRMQGKHFYEKTWDTSFHNVLNAFLTSQTGNYEVMLNNLISETTEHFTERYSVYKEYVKSNYDKNGEAKTVRAASLFLTCYNPHLYVPFMTEVYKNMCNCFYGTGNGRETESKRYPHYLHLLQLLVEIISKDDELHSIVSKNGLSEITTNLLIAQDIAWGFRKTDQIEKLFMNEYFYEMNKDTKFSLTDYKMFLLNNHNMIFTGAPGTGKTYLAKQIAASIIGCSVKELRGNKHFGFVQFHPSYDYTDFVEGLRPSEEEGKEFELRQGIFKLFCATALEKNNSFDEAYARLVEGVQALDKPMSVITPTGAPFGITVNSNGNLNLYTGEKMQKNGVLTAEALKAMANSQPTYPYWQGYYKGVVELLKQKYDLKVSDSENKSDYIFVIDEINRGEISKIFGELFYSIDPGYRGKDGSVKTQYQNMVKEGPFTDGFYVPENVYIIGTMNDIDRSVESLDFAFRRRFPSIEIGVEDTLDSICEQLKDQPVAEEAKKRLKLLNEEILKDESLGAEYCIGGSYLLKLNELKNSFEKLWRYYIQPVIAEYFRGLPSVEKAEKLNTLRNTFLD